jgi:hypothetical protein
MFLSFYYSTLSSGLEDDEKRAPCIPLVYISPLKLSSKLRLLKFC